MDEILEKAGLKYEDLNNAERDQLGIWMSALQRGDVTVDKIKKHIVAMKSAVEQELAKEPEFVRVFIFKFRNDKNILLKARLRNYLLFEGFLTSPDRAKEQLDQAMAGLVNSIKS